MLPLSSLVVEVRGLGCARDGAEASNKTAAEPPLNDSCVRLDIKLMDCLVLVGTGLLECC